MLAFLARRLLQSLLVIGVVLLLAFLLFYYVGDPVVGLLRQDATLTERAELRAQLGLDQPIPIQFVGFLAQLFEGNLGLSYRQGRPVAEMLAEYLPATLELAFVSSAFAVLAGIILGVIVALMRGSLASHAVMAGSLVAVSVPTFVTGILLIQVFAITLGWLPSGGRGDLGGALVDFGFWTTGLLTAEGWSRLVLPALTLAMFQTTMIIRLVRVEMLSVLSSEFIRMARARGVPRRRIYLRHALRNTLVPVVTVAGLQFGVVIAFAIVTETVFNWPGIGRMFIQSVQVVDIPVMAGYFLFVAMCFVTINLIVDLLYLALDPRLRHGSRDGLPAP